MKNLFTTGTICLVAALTFASCAKDDNNDDLYEQYRQQELRIDSILNAQKAEIEAYVTTNLSEAEPDSIYYPFSYIDKRTKRGIWYLYEPGDNEEEDYKYTINSTATNYVFPTVKLTYTAKLLDGTPVESEEAGTFNFSVGFSAFNDAWFLSFFPYSIRYNAQDYVVGGLTENGLQAGDKITVVTPSVLAYGSVKKTGGEADIPADSPLVYEFEVLEIE
ncbi:FKBP-type peptidyl-prolyl cis-trans isomerase [Sphingobacterium sp. SGG-5]|uniref:FKBP-type peptidyl-prolyl cis-trans isomerase n=1 Tax=Sphingobacterium sp. SGG-5 TaxID=2710881 RepID=UPI0013EA0032|nr:FKBP-type peptidyl-prolyl cis-trans isomerase [Sphingobacterium sp. SGG-5]NGM60593.1 FKBP-type peptidyl-prolyl cis-trans isomerase [Sphingobacterium sp. SGG-5]